MRMTRPVMIASVDSKVVENRPTEGHRISGSKVLAGGTSLPRSGGPNQSLSSNNAMPRPLHKTPTVKAKEKGRLHGAGLRLSSQVAREIEDSVKVKTELVDEAAELIAQMGFLVATRLRAGHKLIIFGNGGSAADAQHIAAEFVGRYMVEREALPAIALTTDTSALTAIGNDYGFEHIFSRQIRALAKRGDVALGISTSGESQNVVRGLTEARELGLVTLGFTGRNGGKMRNLVDLCLCVPSSSTPRVQEAHMLVGHILTGIVENVLLSEKKPKFSGSLMTRSR